MMKFIFGTLWGALLVYGVVCFASHRDRDPHWTYNGGRTVDRNYRFSEIDSPYLTGQADRIAYIGRYLETSLSSGQELTAGILSSAPVIEVPTGRVPFPVPLKSQRASLAINANVTVAIWRSQQRIVAAAPVLALLCPNVSSTTTDWEAVLATTTSEAQTLLQNQGEFLLLPTTTSERKQ